MEATTKYYEAKTLIIIFKSNTIAKRMRETMNHNSSANLLALLLLVLILMQRESTTASGLLCREEERAALLQIKDHLSLPRLHSWPSLDSNNYDIEPKYHWEGKECCQWESVTCDPTTGHVAKLDLGINLEPNTPGSDYDPFGYQPLDSGFLLNATIFLPLRQLRSLSLSGQGISGFITGAGLKTWYNLTKLEILDLSYNDLDGSIIFPLAGVPSLRMLQLSHNNISGNLPINGFKTWYNLSMLEILDLSGNDLDGSIIFSLASIPTLRMLQLSNNNISGNLPINGFESWSNLTKLEMLDLSENVLSRDNISSLAKISSLRQLYLDKNYPLGGNLPIKELNALSLEVLSMEACSFISDGGALPYLGYWPSLKALSLANNNLNGTLTLIGLCELKNLEELDLSFNSFTGDLPLCIGNLSSLRLVDLSYNQFEVKFPSSIFERLISLRFLSLSQNKLEGTLSLRSMSNHSNLEVLRLSTSASNFRVEVANLPFQLVDLKLANCMIDAEPHFLFSQHKLQSLDLSNTRSKGLAPTSWLLENNTDLFQLDLHKNFFTGSLQLSFLTHEKLSLLDISDNTFDGELSVDITNGLPNLLFLNLSHNHFQGTLPLISTSRLRVLDLSFNNLTDNIQSFLKIQSSFFTYLDLSNNKFYGSFPNNMNVTTFNNSEPGTTLLLNDNYISGDIPSSICSTNLDVLDVSRNELNGVLPNCIGRSGLSELKLSGNHLKGTLPLEMCDMELLESLDLSNNMLSGSIPPCYNLTNLEFVDLSRNILTGNFPTTWLNLSNIIGINIRKNQLSGDLPNGIGRESNLVMLQARENQFEGIIPEDICQFKYLRILDLSQNKLNGQIPSCIINMGTKEKDILVILFMPDTSSYSFHVGKLKIDTTFLLPIEYGVLVNNYGIAPFELEFMSKERLDIYGKNILQLEGVIDLSSNKLVGNIPENIGQMTWLITLNISNNHFSGEIPNSISNLQQLESLDLSHNSLTGEIPRDLTQLTKLGYFSVAYNNLSGPTLGMEAQFSTFGSDKYEGNPNLCGPPLPKSCSPTLNTTNERNDIRRYEGTDYLILFGSFCLFFVASFWGFVAILYFKRNWRYALFNWVDRYGDVIYVRVVLFARKIKARTLRGD